MSELLRRRRIGSQLSVRRLGRHNRNLIWGNYINKVRLYQGAMQDKAAARSRFLKDTEVLDQLTDYRARFPELVALWEHIFSLLKPV